MVKTEVCYCFSVDNNVAKLIGDQKSVSLLPESQEVLETFHEAKCYIIVTYDHQVVCISICLIDLLIQDRD